MITGNPGSIDFNATSGQGHCHPAGCSRESPRPVESSATISRLPRSPAHNRVIAFPFEKIRDRGANGFFILNNQNSIFHHGSLGSNFVGCLAILYARILPAGESSTSRIARASRGNSNGFRSRLAPRPVCA